MSAHAGEPLLSLEDVEVAYEGIIVGLRGVSLEVVTGTIVALLGPNGAGKTTALKAAAGLLPAERGAITQGRVRYLGEEVGRHGARALVARGLVQVLEGRRCFAQLTVEENLLAGTLVRSLSRAARSEALERTYATFPRLREKRKVQAGYTSGGEQQMVAIGRALLTGPKLVLLDEPSMGLAPKVAQEIFEIIRLLNERDGVTFLLAEQNATLALRHADHGYVLDNGRVVTRGDASELRARPDIRELYLGVDNGGRRRFGARTGNASATT